MVYGFDIRRGAEYVPERNAWSGREIKRAWGALSKTGITRVSGCKDLEILWEGLVRVVDRSICLD